MGKLLLKCDGVLNDSWCPLDGPPPYEVPATWSSIHVQHRYAEAFGIVMRLPAGKLWPKGFWTCWPDWDREWDALMGRRTDIEAMASEGRVSLELSAAHQQWTTDRNQVRRDPPTAAEISLMERAIDWPGQYLRDAPDQARALNYIGLARAREVEVADVVRRGRHANVKAPAVWQELALEAAHRIAVGLRVDRCPVF